jgi:CubicO group peptidase (beta-lactamase class C family)
MKKDRRRFLTRSGLALTLLGAEGLSGAAQTRGTKAKDAWIPSKEFIEGLEVLMEVSSLPGIQVASVDQGEVIWSHCFGVANSETREQVGANSLFQAASMSKPVFAYVVLQLVDDGLIDLDHPLVTYYRPDYLPADERIDRITARHVLTHSSGLPNWGDDTRPETLTPAYEPGAAFRYSGEGFFWLQLVVEHLTGINLESVVRTRLFGPASMIRSTYALDQEHARQSVWGHEHGQIVPQRNRDKLARLEPFATQWQKPINVWTQVDFVRAVHKSAPTANPVTRDRFVNAAASLLTTAEEYAKFVTLLMERKSRARWEIREETRNAMLSPQKVITGSPLYVWGLGVSLEQVPRGRLFEHGGNNDNIFKSFVVGDSKRRRAMVVLTNGDSGDSIYQRIIRAAIGRDLLGFIANLNPPLVGEAAHK